LQLLAERVLLLLSAQEPPFFIGSHEKMIIRRRACGVAAGTMSIV
jgi:hypothetical protein